VRSVTSAFGTEMGTDGPVSIQTRPNKAGPVARVMNGRFTIFPFKHKSSVCAIFPKVSNVPDTQNVKY
jgi:hypothetical protein